MKTKCILLVLLAGSQLAMTESTTLNLHDIEGRFRENALKTEAELKGKPITVDTYVTSVDKVKGKPHIKAYIVYFADGVEVVSDILLKPNQMQAAMKLKPNDHIKVTAVLRKREIFSKESLEIHGYSSSVYNGNGGGGSVNGGTVVHEWPVYTFDSGLVSIIETEEHRARVAAAVLTKKADLEKQFDTAMVQCDFAAAQKVVDLGLDPTKLDAWVQDMARLDPDASNYDLVMKGFAFIVGTNKANMNAPQNAVLGVGAFGGSGLVRPKMFKVLVDAQRVDFHGKAGNGDTFLHFLLKDRSLSSFNGTASKLLKVIFSELDVDMIKIVCESGQAAGAADIKDTYGKSAKDYVKEYQDFGSSFGDRPSPFSRIREMILKLH